MTKITQILNDGDVVNETHFQQIKDVVNTNDDIATPLQVVFSTTVKADRMRFLIGRHDMTGPVAITLDVGSAQTQDEAIPGLGQTLWFLGDGNNITISGGTIVPSQNATIATEAGVELLLVLVWSGSYWQVGIEGANSTAASTIILMQDDFAGTTIDTAKWSFNNIGNPAPDITQNDGMIGNSDGSSVSELLADNLLSLDTFSGKLTFQYFHDAYTGVTPGGGWTNYLYVDDDNRIGFAALGVAATPSYSQRIIIRLAAVNEVLVDTLVAANGKWWKVEIDNGNVIKFYYHLLGSGDWVQVGDVAGYTFNIGTIKNIILGFGNSTGVYTHKIKDIYVSNDFYQTEIPI